MSFRARRSYIRGLLFMFGGSGHSTRCFNDIHVYDPAKNTWFVSAYAAAFYFRIWILIVIPDPPSISAAWCGKGHARKLFCIMVNTCKLLNHNAGHILQAFKC